MLARGGKIKKKRGKKTFYERAFKSHRWCLKSRGGRAVFSPHPSLLLNSQALKNLCAAVIAASRRGDRGSASGAEG